MRLVDQLCAEHGLIEQLAFSLRTFARARGRGAGSAADGEQFLRFLQLYAGDHHHAREERILFHALEHDAGLPAERGPIAALLADHRALASSLAQVARWIAADAGGRATDGALEAVVLAYSERLVRHIDAEESVFFPEAEARLRRRGLAELPTPPVSDEQAEARLSGERLLRLYPPAREPQVLRGDGCVACPAFGDSCRGLEHEWWNEWEWEEFEDHLPAG